MNDREFELLTRLLATGPVLQGNEEELEVLGTVDGVPYFATPAPFGAFPDHWPFVAPRGVGGASRSYHALYLARMAKKGWVDVKRRPTLKRSPRLFRLNIAGRQALENAQATRDAKIKGFRADHVIVDDPI